MWSVWCVKVRPGHRSTEISHYLLAGAVKFAFDQGAPAIESYPVDNRGEKVDRTMAYVGTRALSDGPILGSRCYGLDDQRIPVGTHAARAALNGTADLIVNIPLTCGCSSPTQHLLMRLGALPK